MSVVSEPLAQRPSVVDLADLSTQASSPPGQISRESAETGATGGQAHNAVADMAALLTGTESMRGPGHPRPDVVVLDGTGVRAGDNRNGTGAHVDSG
jgi:hypothetical protein